MVPAATARVPPALLVDGAKTVQGVTPELEIADIGTEFVYLALVMFDR